LASGDNETPWAVDRQRRPYGLRVMLAKRTYVLPWAQFLYAEGAADTVRAVFSMHDVVVTGSGLEALLADFAAQVVTVLQQRLRAESFLPAAGPRILSVEVRRIEGERALVTGGDGKSRGCASFTRRSVSAPAISRPSRKRHRSRRAQR
jgi:hypothetical protein